MSRTLLVKFATVGFGAILAAISVFLGAAVTALALHIYRYGMDAPEMFGWMGLFTVCGLIGLVSASPALLVICAVGFVWHPPLWKLTILNTALPAVLGLVGMAMFAAGGSSNLTLPAYALRWAISVGITSVTLLVLRQKLQEDRVVR